MKVLIIAPHQDDEILAAGGLIQQLNKRGHIVNVLFATNGDYHGSDIALVRYYESCKALNHLGVPCENIFYLGYGDTGMKDTHSFLRRLHSLPPNTPAITPCATTTYHPANCETIHVLRTGQETLLTRDAFFEDLKWFIEYYMPDLLILPHPTDKHGDHAMIYTFIKDIPIFKCIPHCLSYIIHGGDDLVWPNRSHKLYVCPPNCSKKEWEMRISISLTETEMERKLQALNFFKTQLIDDTNGFMLSFCKQEEVFFSLQNDIAIQQNK